MSFMGSIWNGIPTNFQDCHVIRFWHYSASNRIYFSFYFLRIIPSNICAACTWVWLPACLLPFWLNSSRCSTHFSFCPITPCTCLVSTAACGKTAARPCWAGIRCWCCRGCSSPRCNSATRAMSGSLGICVSTAACGRATDPCWFCSSPRCSSAAPFMCLGICVSPAACGRATDPCWFCSSPRCSSAAPFMCLGFVSALLHVVEPLTRVGSAALPDAAVSPCLK